MVYYSDILSRFGYTEVDKEFSLTIHEVMMQQQDNFISDILKYLNSDNHFKAEYSDTLKSINTNKIKLWYKDIISGKLNGAISDFINDFNLNVTPKGGFSAERIAELFNYIRIWFQDKVFDLVDGEWNYKNVLRSYTKIINASIYITMNTYVPKDITMAESSKLKGVILIIAEKASLFTHSILLFFLVLMTLSGVGFFMWSLWDLRGIAPDKFFVTALGSLLVLWVLIELINSEIQMLRGDKFRISVFVGVVLIAFIREVLIMTLKHDVNNIKSMILMLAGILVFGVTYWLLAKSEERPKH